MSLYQIFPFLAIATVVAGCATAPLAPFPPTHPASPEAQEASTPPARPSLAADEATRTTNNLLTGTGLATPSDSVRAMPSTHQH